MIQTGVVEYNPQCSGWNLASGTGERTFTGPDIKFQPPFSAPPSVVLALCGIDSDHATNLRLTLRTSDVEPDEFNIMVSTWDDSLVYSVLVTWIAID